MDFVTGSRRPRSRFGAVCFAMVAVLFATTLGDHFADYWFAYPRSKWIDGIVSVFVWTFGIGGAVIAFWGWRASGEKQFRIAFWSALLVAILTAFHGWMMFQGLSGFMEYLDNPVGGFDWRAGFELLSPALTVALAFFLMTVLFLTALALDPHRNPR